MKPRDYFELLAFMAVVDRELHESEVPLLRGFAQRLQLSDAESAQVMAQVRTGARPTAKMPDAAKDRSTLFRHLARVAVADHRLAPEEMDLLVRVGHALGQDRAKVYDLVDRAMQGRGLTLTGACGHAHDQLRERLLRGPRGRQRHGPGRAPAPRRTSARTGGDGHGPDVGQRAPGPGLRPAIDGDVSGRSDQRPA